MSSDRDRLEGKLAEHMRAYFGAFAHGDPAEQEERLRWVCSSIEWLLGLLLAGCEEFDPYGWLDGVSPWSVSVLPPAGLEVRGLVYWVDGRDEWWLEPFYASIRLSEAGDVLAGYRLSFGNAACGLKRVPLDHLPKRLKPKGLNWHYPDEWLFVFSNGRDSPDD